MVLPKGWLGALCAAFLIGLHPAMSLGQTGILDSDAREVQAWFLGHDREIKWCIQTAPGALEHVDLWFFKDLVDRSIAAWTKYIADKRVNRRLPTGEPPLATRWSYLGTCKDARGSQDIAFYFGNGHDEPNAFRHEFKSPTAFAIRTDYDQSLGWGKGFVWLSDEMTSTFNIERLLPLVAHEIGHVYGCEHIEGTVMDAAIARRVNSPLPVLGTANYVTTVNIDGDRELYFCHDCPFSIVDYEFGARNDLTVLMYRLTNLHTNGLPVRISLDGWRRQGYFVMSIGLWTTEQRELLPLERVGEPDEIQRHLRNAMEVRLHRAPRLIKVSEKKAFRKVYQGSVFARSPTAWTASGALFSRSLRHWPVVINRGLGSAFDIAIYDDHGPVFIYRLSATHRAMITYSAP